MKALRSTTRALGAAVAVLSLAVLAACGGGAAGDTAPSSGSGSPVRITVVAGFGSLPIHVADVKGYFAEHGVNAQILENTSTASFGPGLGKQYDFILSTPMDFLAGASKGIDLTAVSGMQINSAKSPNNVLITKDASITSVADLKGKRVGVVSLAGGGYGAIIFALNKSGLTKSDVTLVATPFATMVDQLNAGNLDAAISTTPFWSTAVKSGDLRIVEDVPFAAAGEGSPNVFYSTSKQYAAANPKIVDGFRAAMKEATTWIDQNPDQARAQLVSWLKLPADVVAASPLPAFDTAMDVGKIEPFVPIAQISGQVSGTVPDLKTLVLPGGST
jgi:NitT/TauT family transport system substrate-binding protein